MVRRPGAAERLANRRRVALGLVALVAGSAVLIAAYGGASPVELALVAVAGTLAGGALVVAIGGWP